LGGTSADAIEDCFTARPAWMMRSHTLHAFGVDDILNTLGGSIALHRVVVSVRRMVLHLPASFPFLPAFRQVALALGASPG
jgi:hypothetical protein